MSWTRTDRTQRIETEAAEPQTTPSTPAADRPIMRKAAPSTSSMPLDPGARTACVFGDAINAGIVMRHGDGDVADHADGLVASAGQSRGQALPGDLRERFESSLGTDLSGVNIHTDDTAAQAAASVGARAYAVGQDVFMGAGEYQPGSTEGDRLLAHEVAHTVQQRGGSATPQFKLHVSSPGDAHETEADAAASAMVSGAAYALTTAPAGAVQRQRTRGGAGHGQAAASAGASSAPEIPDPGRATTAMRQSLTSAAHSLDIGVPEGALSRLSEGISRRVGSGPGDVAVPGDVASQTERYSGWTSNYTWNLAARVELANGRPHGRALRQNAQIRGTNTGEHTNQGQGTHRQTDQSTTSANGGHGAGDAGGANGNAAYQRQSTTEDTQQSTDTHRNANESQYTMRGTVEDSEFEYDVIVHWSFRVEPSGLTMETPIEGSGHERVGTTRRMQRDETPVRRH